MNPYRIVLVVAVSMVVLASCATSGHDAGTAANVISDHEVASPWPGVRETPWWTAAPRQAGPTRHVDTRRGEIRIGLWGDVTFAVDTATLIPSAVTQLQRVLQVAHRVPDATIVIVGYTDSDGTTAHNQQLSVARAGAVAGWLIRHGITTGRVITRGEGAADPLVPNTDDENKARNRRVEITFANPAKAGSL